MSATPHDDWSALQALLARLDGPDASPGDLQAARAYVDRLFAAEHARVRRACLRYLGDPERASEATQDTFLIAWSKIEQWTGESSLYSWLFGIARFRCMNMRSKKADALTEDGLLEPSDPTRGVLLGLRAEERDQLLRDAASAVLDAQEQEALRLRYEEGMAVTEITERLGLTDRSGARGVLQRCRRKLSRELRRRLDELGHGSSLVFGTLG